MKISLEELEEMRKIVEIPSENNNKLFYLFFLPLENTIDDFEDRLKEDPSLIGFVDQPHQTTCQTSISFDV